MRRFTPVLPVLVLFLLAQMKRHLLALNLNGTVPDGDKRGQKIVPLAQGELDAALLTVIRDSGWRGPIGILNHTDEDAEGRLRDNLAGLDWLRQTISGQPTGPRPVPLTWRAPATPKNQTHFDPQPAGSGERQQADFAQFIETHYPAFRVILREK